MQIMDEAVDTAIAGEVVGIQVEFIDPSNGLPCRDTPGNKSLTFTSVDFLSGFTRPFFWGGIVAGHANDHPPRCVKEVIGEVFFSVITKGLLKVGARVMVGCHASAREWQIEEINKIGEEKEKKKEATSGPQRHFILRFSLVRCPIRKGRQIPEEWMVVEPHDAATRLGSFFLYANRRPIGYGKVLSVIEAD